MRRKCPDSARRIAVASSKTTKHAPSPLTPATPVQMIRQFVGFINTWRMPQEAKEAFTMHGDSIAHAFTRKGKGRLGFPQTQGCLFALGSCLEKFVQIFQILSQFEDDEAQEVLNEAQELIQRDWNFRFRDLLVELEKCWGKATQVYNWRLKPALALVEWLGTELSLRDQEEGLIRPPLVELLQASGWDPRNANPGWPFGEEIDERIKWASDLADWTYDPLLDPRFIEFEEVA